MALEGAQNGGEILVQVAIADGGELTLRLIWVRRRNTWRFLADGSWDAIPA